MDTGLFCDILGGESNTAVNGVIDRDELENSIKITQK